MLLHNVGIAHWLNKNDIVDGALDVTGTTIPEFHGNSYMVLEMKEKVGHSFAFEIWFLAKEPNGKC